jgi:hypothetical protein
LETEISKFQEFTIKDKQNSRVIEIIKSASLEKIISLLEILRKYKVAFSLHDAYYPSMSDPGAYINYSQEQNETENSWSMTLGNHGWSGGIYTISESNIALQIKNLVSSENINSIRLDNAKIFSHYDKQNLDKNLNQNALLYSLHSKTTNINSEYLIFGRFSSDNYSPYNIYKLTKNQLFIDKRNCWHSDRHTSKGYEFEGEQLEESKYLEAKELLFEIPLDLLSNIWKGFYTTGNKNEDQLIIEFKNKDYHKTISIDSYEYETKDLPFEIKNFRQKIEHIICKLYE